MEGQRKNNLLQNESKVVYEVLSAYGIIDKNKIFKSSLLSCAVIWVIMEKTERMKERKQNTSRMSTMLMLVWWHSIDKILIIN